MRKLLVPFVLGAALVACSGQVTLPPQGREVSASRRSDVQRFPDNVTGFFVGSCDGFDILSDWSAEMLMNTVVDKAGDPALIEVVYHVVSPHTSYYNSLYPDKVINGGPGETQMTHVDFGKGTVMISGLALKVVLPGTGPIFIDVGSVTLDQATGVITHQGGQHQGWEGDVAALCQALTP